MYGEANRGNKVFMKLVSYFIMASSYRKNIYKKIDAELQSDFIIGEPVGDVRPMDISELRNAFEPKRIHIHGNYCYDKGVLSYVRRNHYDTLIVGGDAYNLTVWCLLLYCRLKGIKVIMWSHGYYGRETKIRDWLKRLFFSFADRLWVYGEYAKNLLSQKAIFDVDKIDVVYNSLDYELQLSLRKKAKKTSVYRDYFQNDSPVLAFIGRLTYAKKLDMIITAVKILKEKNRKLNVVFIGDGEARKSLEAISQDENVWFYGRCFDEAKLSELIYNADLCVSPGFVGLTAMHSLMFGCPVITHDDRTRQAPEFESIISGVTGDFFVKGDIESLARTIESWFDNGLDREFVRAQCYGVMDMRYNPNVQIRIMRESLSKLWEV